MKITPILRSNPYLTGKNVNKKTFTSNSFANGYGNGAKMPDFRFFLPSFGAILYKKTAPEYVDKKKELEEELDIFSATKENAYFLGKGLFSEAYSLDNMPDIVVKQAFDKSETFESEQDNMELVPKDMENSQRFVARVYDDEERRYYLLSTKVNGESADPETMPWTSEHLKNLFDGLFKMDKECVYHGDLNTGNMKLTPDGGVNFLDYQWTHKVPATEIFNEKKESTLPGFIYPENSQMFEMAEIPYYLMKMPEGNQPKQFFKQYLQAKSDYHQKRYDFINKQITDKKILINVANAEKARAFEKAQAEVYKNPSDNVLKTEAKKIQFLNSFREAYKTIDKNVINKNILSAASSYLTAMSATQDFRREVEINAKRVQDKINEIENRQNTFLRTLFPNSQSAKADENKKASLKQEEIYYNGLRDYGSFWFEKLESWTPEAFNFPLRHVSGNLKSWEKQYDFNNPERSVYDFGSMPDILSKLDKNYLPVYNKNFEVKNEENMQKLRENKKNIDELAFIIPKTDVNEVRSKLQQLKYFRSKLNDAYNKGCYLDVLNLSLLSVLKSKELYNCAAGSDSSDDDYISEVMVAARETLNLSESIATELFNELYNQIIKDTPSSGMLHGYKGMEMFT